MYDGPTPALYNFCGAYLHQDFVEDYGTEVGALEAFLHDAPEEAAQLAAEVATVLRDCSSDVQLQEYCWQMGSYFRADWDGGTYRGWLEQVAARAAAYASGR